MENIKATALAFALETMKEEDTFDEVIGRAKTIFEWIIEKEQSDGSVINMVRN